MSETQEQGNVNVTNVQGSASVQMENPAPPPAEAVPQIPEGGSEKFWNAEKGEYNWEADAKEKAWQLAQRKDGEVSSEAEPAPEPANEPAPAEAAEEIAEQAGIDIDQFNAYIVEHGEAPQDALDKLSALGIPEGDVQDFVAWRLESAKAHHDTVMEALGGDEGLSKIQEHMRQNYNAEEIAAFEDQLFDTNGWKAIVTRLVAEAGVPVQGNAPMQGANAGSSATTEKAYASDAEFQRDLRDPRYRQDPAFREMVLNRMRATNSGPMNPRSHSGGL